MGTISLGNGSTFVPNTSGLVVSAMMQMYEKAYVDKLVDVYEAAKKVGISMDEESDCPFCDYDALVAALDAIEQGEKE